MSLFIDRQPATLKNVRRTAVGGLLVDATLARVGVLEYVEGGKVIRRYNPEAVLAASLDALPTAPVTNRHPRKFVDGKTYRDVAAGHLVGQPKLENGHIVATLAIQDERLIEDVESGRTREVSLGYHAEHDGMPGTTPEGETYDEARTRVYVNHIALVPAGRAGRTVRVLLDSEDIPQELEDEEIMTKIKIGDKEVALDAAQSTFDAYDGAVQAELATLRASVATLTEAKDAAEAKATPEAIQALVDAKLKEIKDSETRAERVKRLAVRFPSVTDLDKRSNDFLDALEAAVAADPEGLGKVQSKDEKPVVTTDAKPARETHAERLAREAFERSRAPLAPEKV
jgi:hypothetical protein